MSDIDSGAVDALLDAALERHQNRMDDLESAVERLAESLVAWPDENVDAALCAVQSEIGGLQTGKQVTVSSAKGSYSYDYITEGQITAELRRRLCSRGVAVWVSEAKTSKDGSLTTVELDVTFAHCRSGTERVVRMSGQGTDPGDKGHTKAMTTALRVGLCKLLLQSGDLDPEESNYDHRSTPEPAAAPPPLSRRQVLYDTLARWCGGDLDALRSLTSELGVSSIREATDEQLQLMEDFVAWVRGQDSAVIKERLTDEGWQSIAKRWYEAEGSVTL